MRVILALTQEHKDLMLTTFSSVVFGCSCTELDPQATRCHLVHSKTTTLKSDRILCCAACEGAHESKIRPDIVQCKAGLIFYKGETKTVTYDLFFVCWSVFVTIIFS